MMTSSNSRRVVAAAVGLGLAVPACRAGNQGLVEQKTSELQSINEQVMKQAAPAGLKEGDAVEVKAWLRVERTQEKALVVRDVALEKMKGVEKQPAEGGVAGVREECLQVPATGRPAERAKQPAEGAPPPPAAAEKNVPAEGKPGFRQELLNVPPVNKKRKE